MARTPASIEYAARAPAQPYAFRQFMAEPSSSLEWVDVTHNGGYCLDAPDLLPAGSHRGWTGFDYRQCKADELIARDGWERR